MKKKHEMHTDYTHTLDEVFEFTETDKLYSFIGDYTLVNMKNFLNFVILYSCCKVPQKTHCTTAQAFTVTTVQLYSKALQPILRSQWDTSDRLFNM